MNLLLERKGPVFMVAINRPQARNAVNSQTAAELRLAFDQFEKAPEAKVALLSGAGGNFCAGYDLKEAAKGDFLDTYQPEGDGPMGPTRRLLKKPVIAAVEGFAVAGGLELALWCDLRVAGQGSVFGVFCRRFGVPLIDGGTVRLPRLVGQGRALEMILTGRPVSAEEALAWGLVNQVTPAGRALDAAFLLAESIANFPLACMRGDRESAYAQWDLPMKDALAREGREGLKPLLAESAAGARRFAGGAGRGGNFQG